MEQNTFIFDMLINPDFLFYASSRRLQEHIIIMIFGYLTSSMKVQHELSYWGDGSWNGIR